MISKIIKSASVFILTVLFLSFLINLQDNYRNGFNINVSDYIVLNGAINNFAGFMAILSAVVSPIAGLYLILYINIDDLNEKIKKDLIDVKKP